MQFSFSRLRQRGRRLATSLISLYILVVLGLQTEETFQVLAALHPGYRPPYMWPFFDYSMYCQAYYEGSRFDEYHVVGAFEDAAEVRLNPEDLGINFWQFRNTVVKELQREKPNAATLEEFADLYEARYGRRLIAIRLGIVPYVLTGDGFREAPAETVRVVTISSAGAPANQHNGGKMP